ncbi:class I SAM-dependent DNA methyltransferase [Streptomyces cavernae]|uniref:class I SAM-dependent DNA methyltransferase n=1 Tax=Streptomyces cavernae TaxID=2259034 RepID=UPI000FEBA6B7|nr:class I SAM-dependent methyltransferase [Streptomyces cavernae]
MVDRAFGDASLAGLYDALNPWGAGEAFYLELVLGASAVLDVGCGTGVLLRCAREAGHGGRLCGLDPAAAMLVQARRRAPAVEWVLGDLVSARGRWDGGFDLATMTGHAFQVLISDAEIRTALAAVREMLAPGGHFVFETRNPAARAWEQWTPDRVRDITDAEGRPVRVWHEVETPVSGELVTFAETFEGPAWPRPQISHSTLRFLGAEAVAGFVREAGLVVQAQYGDWDRRPMSATGPEIITVAQRID